MKLEADVNHRRAPTQDTKGNREQSGNTGAGAGAQKAIGTCVLGGMVTGTLLVILFSPLFYVLIVKAFGKDKRRGAAERSGANPSGETSI